MLDPFKLSWRLVVAGFRIIGYLIACGAQILWYASHAQMGKIGDAIGFLGRGITDALADVLKE